MPNIQRTQAEIDDVLNRCVELIDDGGSAVPGMSYEEGVDAAIRWILGESVDHPLAP